MASILTLGSGNTSNVIHDVNTIVGGEKPSPKSSSPPPADQALNTSQTSNQGKTSTGGSTIKPTHHQADQESHVSPSLAPHNDNNPFV